VIATAGLAKRQEAKAGTPGAETSAEEVDASFAQMSKRFHDEGGEIYLPAAE
jgi:hypothetical protein